MVCVISDRAPQRRLCTLAVLLEGCIERTHRVVASIIGDLQHIEGAGERTTTATVAEDIEARDASWLERNQCGVRVAARRELSVVRRGEIHRPILAGKRVCIDRDTTVL